MAQRSRKCAQQRPGYGMEVAAQGAGIRRGRSSHLAHDRVSHQVPFARPAPIDAAAAPLDLLGNPGDRDRAITSPSQGLQHGGDDFGVDALVAWPPEMGRRKPHRLEEISSSHRGTIHDTSCC